MTDTRVWAYCWREHEPEADNESDEGKILAQLFDSEDDIPADGHWGQNLAHARVLAGLDFDPAIHGELPEGVQPRKKRGRPRKKPQDNGDNGETDD